MNHITLSISFSLLSLIPLQLPQGSVIISATSHGEIFSVMKCVYLVKYMTSIYI